MDDNRVFLAQALLDRPLADNLEVTALLIALGSLGAMPGSTTVVNLVGNPFPDSANWESSTPDPPRAFISALIRANQVAEAEDRITTAIRLAAGVKDITPTPRDIVRLVITETARRDKA